MISLFGFDLAQPPAGRYQLVDGIVHFLSTTVSGLLDELAGPFELVWCSGWEEKADEVLPAVLGLPSGLAHLSFSRTDDGTPRHWKLAAIDAFAGASRALAWVDDALDDSCDVWAEQRAGPTRLVRTDPAVGLTADQTAGLARWASRLRDESAGWP